MCTWITDFFKIEIQYDVELFDNQKSSLHALLKHLFAAAFFAVVQAIPII